MNSNSPDTIVCHCFGYTRQNIMEEARRDGTSAILKRITRSKLAGECRCHETHPEKR
ncbi:MAG: hypothetical protein MI742_02765 [Desulfobacterales bacterium]|nr:hypothetical protein [Desulfobacterales bacterium]